MSAYALAHLRTPTINDDTLEYIERIQATMDPYGGRFLVHGAEVDVKEGEWPGTVVVLEFPNLTAAHQWYDSPAFQEILPLRLNSIEGERSWSKVWDRTTTPSTRRRCCGRRRRSDGDRRRTATAKARRPPPDGDRRRSPNPTAARGRPFRNS